LLFCSDGKRSEPKQPAAGTSKPVARKSTGPRTPKTPVTPKSPQRRRFRPGTRALMEIRKFQKSTNLLVPRLSFARVVREIAVQVLVKNFLLHFFDKYFCCSEQWYGSERFFWDFGSGNFFARFGFGYGSGL
jgi:hypothetical protein